LITVGLALFKKNICLDSAKLYDFYVNGFDDSESKHHAHVHLPPAPASAAGDTPKIYSAPTVLDLLNTENVNPHDMDMEALESQLFNHPDPYDLEETNRIDPTLQVMVTRSTTHFAIADYVKLDDRNLKALITNIDSEGPGLSIEMLTAFQVAKPMGKPGDWDIDSFLDGEGDL
jgi:hypothetical protein